MSELVQNSRKIKTTINGDLSWKRDDNGSIYFDCKFMPNWKIPRGIKCSGITLPKGLKPQSTCHFQPLDAQLREFFEETCRALKSQRITCTRFFLDSNILNNDQWAILFNQLKPVNICIYSDLSNRYEVLLKAEQRVRSICFFSSVKISEGQSFIIVAAVWRCDSCIVQCPSQISRCPLQCARDENRSD